MHLNVIMSIYSYDPVHASFMLVRRSCYRNGMVKSAIGKTGLPLGRPMQTRSRTAVETILKAAGAGEVGYAKLSTDMIAKRAGSPVRSVYRSCGNNDDIITAVVDQLFGRTLAFAGELDADPAARDRHAFAPRLVEGIAAIEAEAARSDGLARKLRRTLTACLDRSFAEAFCAAGCGGMNATAELRKGTPKMLIRPRPAGMIPFMSRKKWNGA